ncbi:hypothetical protein Tco_0581718 [Tanacetum coccineum]
MFPLMRVIPFFKNSLKRTLCWSSISPCKEVKVMEEIFDQMNNEVDKNTVDKQCAEIEKKNLLIENENLIVNCLSTQLLYDVEKSRCLDLEADMSKVHDESKLISKKWKGMPNCIQSTLKHLEKVFDNKIHKCTGVNTSSGSKRIQSLEAIKWNNRIPTAKE